MKLQHLLPIGISLLLMLGCNNPEDGKTNENEDVTAYLTRSNATALFAKSTFAFTSSGQETQFKVTYDKNATGPQMEGFGLAITTATAIQCRCICRGGTRGTSSRCSVRQWKKRGCRM